MGGGKTETQYEVKWKGWDKKHNTYEPLSNLAGCEDMVSEYKERKRQRDAELEAEERDKKRQKQEEDLRKSEKDSTLEHSLFAAFNCD